MARRQRHAAEGKAGTGLAKGLLAGKEDEVEVFGMPGVREGEAPGGDQAEQNQAAQAGAPAGGVAVMRKKMSAGRSGWETHGRRVSLAGLISD